MPDVLPFNTRGWGGAPSGAPSDTTRSAFSPWKCEMTCSAVTLLVISPCIWVTPSMAAIGCRSTATILGALSGLRGTVFCML